MHKLIESKAKRVLCISICVLFVSIGFYLGMKIPWSKQISMYAMLRQMGVLILGVIGAWLAVLLPFSVDKSDKLENFFRFTKKLFPALSSAIYLLCLGLFIPLIVDVTCELLSVPQSLANIGCGITMALLCLGIVLILYGFLMILSSFDALKTDIDKRNSAAEVEEKVGPRNKTSK